MQLATAQDALELKTPGIEAEKTILTPEASAFVVDLVRAFRGQVTALLSKRVERQAAFDQGQLPDFLEETAAIRQSDWRVAPLPTDLLDRRVEITGPVDRKMIINALNSGANVFMADFEDSSSPTWRNMLEGQLNLRDAVRGTIRFEDTARGKTYEVGASPATLMVRPRGWHLIEKHVVVDGAYAPASLVDFGLYFFHNARELVARGSGPYFYLPKLESHHEARLWNDVFVFAQKALDLPLGTIKATVLIETLPAAFEMDEILHELRDHSAGLNCGRWDYIFSFIKTVRAHAEMVMPDRGDVGMTQPCMSGYSQLVIKTCHRRGVHAMGGMAAQIPIKNDPRANELALAKVRRDKEREARDGHDGTWVAHPGLVAIAREVFDAEMPQKNQIERARDDVEADRARLLAIPTGARTEAGLRLNVSVGISYLEAWLRGSGCVPIQNLMEDAATAEISRTQIWQWIRHGAKLEDGRTITPELVSKIVEEELVEVAERLSVIPNNRLQAAQNLFCRLVLQERCETFLTLPAYELLVASEQPQSQGDSHVRCTRSHQHR